MKRGEEKPLTWGWHPRGHEQRSMWAGPACAFTLPEKLESLSFWSCPLGFRRERFPDVFSAPDMPRLAGAILNFREALDLRVWVHGKCFCLTCNPISTDADFLPSLGVLWRTHPPFISWLVPIVWEIGQGDTNVPKIPRRDQLLTSKSQRLRIRGIEDEWLQQLCKQWGPLASRTDRSWAFIQRSNRSEMMMGVLWLHESLPRCSGKQGKGYH